jgi:hypothetical protein
MCHRLLGISSTHFLEHFTGQRFRYPPHNGFCTTDLSDTFSNSLGPLMNMTIGRIVNEQNFHVTTLLLFVFDKRALAIFPECQFQFSLGVHDDGTSPGDRFVQRFSG